MADAPRPYEVDPEILIQESKSLLEGLLGKTILPAQPEMQIVLAWAERETVHRALINHMLAQNLTQFSTAPILDNKAANVGLTRLGALPATTVIRFTLTPGHAGITIPAATRVGSTDGQVEFATNYERYVPPGTSFVDIESTATRSGLQGNNQRAGAIQVIITSISFVQTAENLSATEGGSEQETDEQLRQRIILAPARYSSAGTKPAYKFHTLSASPRIIDAEILSAGNGIVRVYPLVEGGFETPAAILNIVQAKLMQEDIRPINDVPEVVSPTKMDYVLEIQIWLWHGVAQTTAIDAALAGIQAYADRQERKLGGDISVSQLTTAAMKGNEHLIKDIFFNGFEGLKVPPTAFAVLGGTSIIFIGYENPNE